MKKPSSAVGMAVASMNKRGRDPLLGKEVLITGGPWKGQRGRVTQLDDRQAIVEVSSVCRKLPIDRENVKDMSLIQRENNGGADGMTDVPVGGRTVYEAGKTPMQYNTPSYYPHSPHWGAAATPGQGGTEYAAGGMSPGFSRPGSEYHAGYSMGATRLPPGGFKRE